MVIECHYDILNVDRDATNDEIKKSYRKLALKCHPDKNPDAIEECTKRFHLLQAAYELLTDPQERAWYDKNRDAILRGGLGGGDKYEDSCVDVYQYFTSACYSGFGDNDEGFYGVYRKVFESIAAEDLEFMQDMKSNFEIPWFGKSTSNYDEVVNVFYGYWQSYYTSRSYVWVDEFDTRDAPNKYCRKMMEKDNKKLRDKAKKERNEQVRALVRFVKKRDKRVKLQIQKLKEESEEAERKVKLKQDEERVEKLKKVESYQEASWSSMSALEEELAKLEQNIYSNFDSEELEEVPEDQAPVEEDLGYDPLFCIACNKQFKSEKAMGNHENSKKHKEAVALLRSQFEEDDAIHSYLNPTSTPNATTGTDSMLDEDASFTKLSKKDKKRRKQRQQFQDFHNGDSYANDISNLATHSDSQPSHDIALAADRLSPTPPSASATSVELPTSTTESSPIANITTEDSSDVAEVPTTSATADVPVMNGHVHGESSDTGNVTEGGIDGTSEQVGATAEPSGGELTQNTGDCDKDEEAKGSEEDSDEDQSEQKSGKKKKKKVTINEGLLCNTCQKTFPTRNQLFSHLKKTGHALKVEGKTVTVKRETKRDRKEKRSGRK